MSGFSDYLEGEIAKWIIGTDMQPAPDAVYVALFNGDPTDTGAGGDDVTTDIRAAGRVAATFSRSGGVLTSNADVDFGDADTLTDISHFAIFDAATTGNMLGSNALTGGAKTVGAGTTVVFPSGDLTVSID